MIFKNQTKAMNVAFHGAGFLIGMFIFQASAEWQGIWKWSGFLFAGALMGFATQMAYVPIKKRTPLRWSLALTTPGIIFAIMHTLWP